MDEVVEYVYNNDPGWVYDKGCFNTFVTGMHSGFYLVFYCHIDRF